jgi:hypothetical protein
MFVFGLVMLVGLCLQFLKQANKGTLDLGAILMAIYVMLTMVD